MLDGLIIDLWNEKDGVQFLGPPVATIPRVLESRGPPC
jgi:hypothetical protein